MKMRYAHLSPNVKRDAVRLLDDPAPRAPHPGPLPRYAGERENWLRQRRAGSRPERRLGGTCGAHGSVEAAAGEAGEDRAQVPRSLGRSAPEGLRDRRARLSGLQRPDAAHRLHRPGDGREADPRPPRPRLDRAAGSPSCAAAGAGRSRPKLRRRGPHLPRVSQRALAAVDGRVLGLPRNVPNALVGSGGLWHASTPRGRASGGGYLQDAHYRSRITVWSSYPPSEICVANLCTRLRPQAAPSKPAMPQALTGKARTAHQSGLAAEAAGPLRGPMWRRPSARRAPVLLAIDECRIALRATASVPSRLRTACPSGSAYADSGIWLGEQHVTPEYWPKTGDIDRSQYDALQRTRKPPG